MNEENTAEIIRSLERMTENENRPEVYKKVFKSFIKIPKERYQKLLLIGIIMSIKIISIGFSNNTISIFLNIVSYSNNFAIPVFTLIFTGYAIFQALSNRETLSALLSVNENNRSKFEEYNFSFLSTAIFFLCIIGLNYIILVLFSGVSTAWHLSWLSNQINNIIATILIWIYLMINIHALLEVSSFILNLYDCFSINAIANGIDQLKENQKNTHN